MMEHCHSVPFPDVKARCVADGTTAAAPSHKLDKKVDTLGSNAGMSRVLNNLRHLPCLASTLSAQH